MTWLTLASAFGGLGGVIAALVQTIRLGSARAERDAIRKQLDEALKAQSQCQSNDADRIARYEALVSSLKTEIVRLESAARLAVDLDPLHVRDRLKRLLGGVAIIGALLFFPSCRHVELVPAEVSMPCLAEPPPASSPVTFADRDRGCPDSLAVCLDALNALVLEQNITNLRRWSTEAWIRCGPTPKGSTP